MPLNVQEDRKPLPTHLQPGHHQMCLTKVFQILHVYGVDGSREKWGHRRKRSGRCPVQGIAYLRQECHNSKFGIFFILWVQKETFADSLLTGVVS